MSLLNTIRALMRTRNVEQVLQGGSLKLIEGLPKDVLGYTRTLDDKQIIVLLNLDDREKEFQIEAKEIIFKLSSECHLNDRMIHLGSYGGLILK
jgi:glycosidase